MGAPARPAAVAAIQDDAMQPPAAPTVDQDLETQPLTIAADQAAHEAHNNGMYETITLTPSTMAMSGANDGFEVSAVRPWHCSQGKGENSSRHNVSDIHISRLLV